MQALALGLAVTAASAAVAQAQTKIRMVLNWKYEGPQGMFFLAQDRGYFKQEGLDVAFDQGNGSGARFDATLADEMSHPEIAKIGIGDVSDERMAKAIDILVKAKDLPRAPTVGEIFDRSFLPPAAERPTSVRPAT
jgi:hypothetical protein